MRPAAAPCVGRPTAAAAAVRAFVVASMATETPLRILDPIYSRDTGSWTLPLPSGCRPEAFVPPSPPALYPCPVGGSLPPLPGTDASIELFSQDEGGVGGRVWRASGMLGRWLVTRRHLVQNARVLELGAGTGASGLFAAALGAERVVLTDGIDELVPLLRKNAAHNRHLLHPGTEVVAARWLFGEPPPPECCCSSSGEAHGHGGGDDGDLFLDAFDLVIGSDITYSVNEAPDALSETLVRILDPSPSRGEEAPRRRSRPRPPPPKCIIAHEHRRSDMFDVDAILRNEPANAWDENDVCLGIFLASAARHGLRVTPLETLRGTRRLLDLQQEVDSLSVEMTTDLSVFEVELEGWPRPRQ